MKQLSSLFDTYRKRIKPPQATVEREVVTIIEEVTGVVVDIKQLSYSTASRTVTITAPSVVKSELLRSKSELMTRIRQQLGATNAPVDIR